MKLVVWLGNPWQQYKATRHNIWATMLERFLDWEKVWKLKYDNKWKAEMLTTDHKIPVENILVLHDEIDFVVGRVAMKKWWSAAWHNGLRSIISKLWTNDFWRIRIGIWRPATSNMVADYVLSTFKPNEKDLMDEKFDEISDFILKFLNSNEW